MDVEKRGGQLFCGAVLNSCPYPGKMKQKGHISFHLISFLFLVAEPWRVSFPKPKPASIDLPVSIGKNFTVLQLSDFHMDVEYLVKKKRRRV
jgi:sphingomyelin phosphodiesterase